MLKTLLSSKRWKEALASGRHSADNQARDSLLEKLTGSAPFMDFQIKNEI
jgi:hypothetical protein